MASLIQWTWVWVNFGSWWWAGRPGVLQFMKFVLPPWRVALTRGGQVTCTLALDIFHLKTIRYIINWNIYFLGKAYVLSHIWLCNPMDCSMLGFPVHLPEFTQTHDIGDVIQPSHPLNHLIPLLLPPSIFPSIRVFSNESALRIRWPKYWSFSFSISPSNEYLGLISFRTGLILLIGTLKGILQHHSSKASILQTSAFFMVQLSLIHTWLLKKP